MRRPTDCARCPRPWSPPRSLCSSWKCCSACSGPPLPPSIPPMVQYSITISLMGWNAGVSPTGSVIICIGPIEFFSPMASMTCPQSATRSFGQSMHRRNKDDSHEPCFKELSLEYGLFVDLSSTSFSISSNLPTISFIYNIKVRLLCFRVSALDCSRVCCSCKISVQGREDVVSSTLYSLLCSNCGVRRSWARSLFPRLASCLCDACRAWCCGFRRGRSLWPTSCFCSTLERRGTLKALASYASRLESTANEGEITELIKSGCSSPEPFLCKALNKSLNIDPYSLLT
eukprot:TRINITY_DN8371_c0_g2_i3.p1 TRINITY_DN8371_c0_g2~~TRINITY_DN8371_c0_g2_i3.p1  ORF type:complete len:287 (+),score=-59.68 TRINITY_DN8371_c0_g2_i3:439-1299(+)